jgi:hypothetical protein
MHFELHVVTASSQGAPLNAHLKRCRKLLKNMKRRARNYGNKTVSDKRTILCDLAEAAGHVSVLFADRLIEKFAVQFEPLSQALREAAPASIEEEIDKEQLALPLEEGDGENIEAPIRGRSSQ